ncbi:TPA: hypothetical protein ACH3X2_005835 [Trebouxia sp. C0005]
MAEKQSRQPDSIKRPQVNSFLCQQTYTCSFGPEDDCSRLPEALTQMERPKNSRIGSRDNGTSRKRGCLSSFMRTQLYLCSDVMRLSVRQSQHSGAAGNLVHGNNIHEQDVKHNHAPGLSQKIKDWVRSQLLDGQTAQQINTRSRLTTSHTSRSNSDRRQASVTATDEGDELAKSLVCKAEGLTGCCIYYGLWHKVDLRIRYKQAYKTAGFKSNRKGEGVLTDAVIAAQAIPNSYMELIDSSGGTCH